MGAPTIFRGTATTTLARVNMVNRLTGKQSFATSAVVNNLDTGSIALKVYIPNSAVDQGLDYFTVPANSSRTIPGPFAFLGVQSASSTLAYEVLASVA